MPAAAEIDAVGSAPRPTSKVVDEADDYSAAVAGVTIESIRVGRGVGPNVVLGVPTNQLTVTSSRFGFPMTSRAEIPTDRIVAAHIHRNPAGSKWCGVPLRAGSVLLYTPGDEHAAINQPGLHFTFAIAETNQLASVVDRLGLATDLPCHGGLSELTPSFAASCLARELGRLTSAANGGEPVERHARSILVAFAEALQDASPRRRIGRARGLDSREIVADCIDYAGATDRLPSIAEMCLAAHVSERRLRSAFTDEFDCSPSRYFRAWALDRAHRRLRDAAPEECSVTQTACDLGFEHLGRFSGWYRQVYGENPSATLHSG